MKDVAAIKAGRRVTLCGRIFGQVAGVTASEREVTCPVCLKLLQGESAAAAAEKPGITLDALHSQINTLGALLSAVNQKLDTLLTAQAH
jgi:hypothetical protein